MTLSAGNNSEGSIVDLSVLKQMQRPLLVASSGNVGSKVEIAHQLDMYQSIGEDLVAKVVDNLVISGATPLFITDYISLGKVAPERTTEIISGISKGCMKAGTALLEGKPVESRTNSQEAGIDLAGMATGVVDADLRLGANRVKEGDLIVAMPASGIHASGFSLVLQILATQELDLTRNYDFNKSLGEVLLTPSEIYTLDCLALIKSQQANIRNFSHITEGGIAFNTAQVIPEGLAAIYDRSTWSLPQEMKFLADIASLSQADLEQSWNAGIGMSAIVDPAVGDLIIRSLAARGMKAWIAGTIEKAAEMGAPRSYLVSEYK
jgi:phosphoribosylformylglycinamidine cyclo-ligase